MLIQKVKWRKHSILGDLLLDFSRSSDSAYKTIVLAGENGTGKSSVLESLSKFLNLGSFAPFEFIEYSIGDEIFTAVPASDGTSIKNFFDVRKPDGTQLRVRSDRSNQPAIIDSTAHDLRRFGCVYSRARADYRTEKIKTTTTSELDARKHDNDSNDDFTALKQLIVDVSNQDYGDYARTNQTRVDNPMPWEEFYRNSKLHRFKESFNGFFESIKFDGVEDESNEKTIKFVKGGSSIPVDDLSTGEKQIVFRGAHLLRNKGSLQDGAIFIDEPELSMHPKWQEKILAYYQQLFKKNGAQTVQLFFATHSDHVVRAALRDKDAIVIILEKSDGNLHARRVDTPFVLPTVTSAETNYRAFDLATIDFHIELFGWLQQSIAKSTVKEVDEYIVNHTLFDPKAHTKVSNFRSTTYATLTTYVRNAIHHPESGKIFTESELRASIDLLSKMLHVP